MKSRRPPEETWSGANEARFQKLRVNKARRVARNQGLSLRESDYGFSLVDGLKGHIVVDGKPHMDLDGVESYLKRAPLDAPNPRS
jgi:hypothetical protein